MNTPTNPTQLQTLLAALAEAAPDVCRRDKSRNLWLMGEYKFWEDDTGFWAGCGVYYVTGQPAADWLRGALERAIEARGWHVDTKMYQSDHHARIFDDSKLETLSGWQATAAHALLAAFVAACEAASERKDK